MQDREGVISNLRNLFGRISTQQRNTFRDRLRSRIGFSPMRRAKRG